MRPCMNHIFVEPAHRAAIAALRRVAARGAASGLDRIPARKSGGGRLPRGMTLVELLVVVMIMVILLGIALPAIRPALEDRKIREASRQFNAFLRAAQSRAAQNNGAYGVWISRTDNTDPNISYQVYFAETPPPYVGEAQDAALAGALEFVDPNPANPSAPGWLRRATLSGSFALMVMQDSTNPASSTLVNRGDRIRFNYSGPDYVIYDVYSDTPLVSNPGQPTDLYLDVTKAPGAGQIIFGPAPGSIQPQPDPATGRPILDGSKFQIFRQPRRTTAGALSLPNGTGLILGLSGMEGIVAYDSMNNLIADRNEFLNVTAAPTPVVVMFRPDGSVDRVYHNNNGGVMPDAPIHFLIGRSLLDDRTPVAVTSAPPAAQDELMWQNLNDQRNLWVAIGHRTGSITTAPMQDWSLTAGVFSTSTLVAKTQAARGLTRNVQSVGGN